MAVGDKTSDLHKHLLIGCFPVMIIHVDRHTEVSGVSDISLDLVAFFGSV